MNYCNQMNDSWIQKYKLRMDLVVGYIKNHMIASNSLFWIFKQLKYSRNNQYGCNSNYSCIQYKYMVSNMDNRDNDWLWVYQRMKQQNQNIKNTIDCYYSQYEMLNDKSILVAKVRSDS